MPEPLLYLQAFVITASASALVVLTLGWLGRLQNAAWLNVSVLVSLTAGHFLGYYWLQLPVRWPPASALDRYLLFVLPVALLVELLTAIPQTPRWLADCLRCVLAISLGRVLLHSSVYLTEWNALQTAGTLALCAAIPAILWLLLARLAERGPGATIPLALALTIQGAGVAIMLAGYIKGGGAAMVAAAALGGITLVCLGIRNTPQLPSLLGLGVISLSSLLIIGVFFGRLPVASAVVLGATPLLCWLTELPAFKRQAPWRRAALQLTLVAVVVAIVLLIAKRKFDREFRPLLGLATTSRLPAVAADPLPRTSSRSN